ncbi:MAG: phosphatase PAP2 family protein [Limosilactobacillus pontis]
MITHLGDPLLLLPLSLVVLVGCWWCHQRAWGLRFAGLQLVGYCLVIAVKYSILRPRPDHKLIPANGFSFPSGHTFATTVFVLAILTLVWPHLRRHWQRIASSILAMVWIFLVMASRVYLRNHYTSDVLAGLFSRHGLVVASHQYPGPFRRYPSPSNRRLKTFDKSV